MKIHMVKQGDTLFELSQKYGLPLEDLIKANPQIADPDVLNIGDKVKIPGGVGTVPEQAELYHKHTVKQGDTLWKLSKAWGIQLKDVIEANPQLKNPDVLKIGEIVNIPKKGTIAPPVHAEPAASGSDAMATASESVGGKTYTGPIEEAPGTTSASPVEQPAKAYTAPVEQLPAKTYTGPVYQPAPPVPVAPVPAPAPAPEVVHTETQSLFVQISVPAQEAVVYEPQPAPAPCHAEPAGCGGVSGYPGLTENPHFYDCPPAYPLYEQAAQPCYPGISQADYGTYSGEWAPSYAEPAYNVPGYAAPGHHALAYAAPCYLLPEHQVHGAMPGYAAPGYAAPGYAAQGYPEASYAGAAHTPPAYTGTAYGSPSLYGASPSALPWPSCGCGGEGAAHWPVPHYEVSPQSSPYGTQAPYALYAGSPAGQHVSSAELPPMPEFPGADWSYLNRIQPVVQEPSVTGEGESITAVSEAVQSANHVPDQAAEVKSAEEVKAKVSGRGASSKANSSSSAKRSARKTNSETSKKRKNPWVSQ